MSMDERPLLSPVIGPLAALLIDREMGEWLQKRAAELRRIGQQDTARQLTSAAAQLRESARQFVEWRASAAGSAELPEPGDGAESFSPPWTADRSGWWSTAVAGKELGVSRRQAWNLAQEGGPLTSVTAGGRLLIDPVSVIEEKQRRERQRGEVA